MYVHTKSYSYNTRAIKTYWFQTKDDETYNGFKPAFFLAVFDLETPKELNLRVIGKITVTKPEGVFVCTGKWKNAKRELFFRPGATFIRFGHFNLIYISDNGMQIYVHLAGTGC